MPWKELQHHRRNKTTIMIIKTIEDFIKSIPTAEGTKFQSIQPFIISADSEIKTMLVGADLYDYIEALGDTDSIKVNFQNLIAFTAYQNAIPFVDLVQTDNGFAVVSNNNLAPASKERVERLLQWCKQSIDKTTDLLIMQFVISATALAEWKKCSQFNNLTNCFFFTGIDFANYAKTDNGSRSDFLKAKGKLITDQKNELTERLSVNYITQLLEDNRSNSLTDKDAYVVDVCKLALAKFYEDNKKEAHELLTNLIVLIENDLDSYPVYKASAEYALKISPKYENKQSDPTFFFGM